MPDHAGEGEGVFEGVLYAGGGVRGRDPVVGDTHENQHTFSPTGNPWAELLNLNLTPINISHYNAPYLS